MRKIYWQIGSIFSLLVLNTFVKIDSAHAFSCDYLSPIAAMKGSSRTFIGRVLSIKDDPNSETLTVEFAVRHIWKGKKQSRIIVDSPSRRRIGFEVGEEYLVYTTNIDGNGEYAGTCSSTSKLSEINPADIRALRKGHAVR
jgi:hypothetical protein